MPSLGLMTLVHKRPQLLPLIVDQVVATWPDAIVDFGMDRPSEIVFHTCCELAEKYPDNVQLWNVPEPAVDYRENFIPLRQLQLERLHKLGVNYCAMWDDDHILAHPEEAKRVLEQNPVLVYCHKLYLWDRPETINIGLPGHNSVLFSKRLDGDRFGGNMVNAPDEVLRRGEGNFVQLQTWLLDFGYMTETERKRVWEVYKRAGKIDPLTIGLLKPPTLHRIDKELAESKWYQRLKEAVR